MTSRAVAAIAREIDTEARRLGLDRVLIRRATAADMMATLEWLREEYAATGRGFYCNRSVIERVHAQGDGRVIVARSAGRAVGLLVMSYDSDPEIMTVHPRRRREGIGRRLLAWNIRQARRQGVSEINAHCVTRAGGALCRAVGFRLNERTLEAACDDRSPSPLSGFEGGPAVNPA